MSTLGVDQHPPEPSCVHFATVQARGASLINVLVFLNGIVTGMLSCEFDCTGE